MDVDPVILFFCPCGVRDFETMVQCEGICELWFHVGTCARPRVREGLRWICRDCRHREKLAEPDADLEDTDTASENGEEEEVVVARRVRVSIVVFHSKFQPS